jgi:hypothetical protein
MNKRLLLCKLAEIAYKRDSRIKEELKKLGFYNSIIREIKDLKYFITFSNEEIYISVRGSANKKNWWRNINCLTKKGIHRGFLGASKIIFKDIEELGLKDLPINLTGHSFGSAVASLLGINMKVHKYNIKSVYAYGQPRVCKKRAKLKDKIGNIDYRRYVNNVDIVCQVPPSCLGFKHFGSLRYVDSNGIVLINPSNETISIDRIKTLENSKNIEELIKDHEVSYYVSLLELSDSDE